MFLENSVDGGESIVVDGFCAAMRLKYSHPDSLDLLTRYCARFEYSGSAAVRVRLWDEAAKVPDMRVAPFEHYSGLLQRVVDRHCRSS